MVLTLDPKLRREDAPVCALLNEPSGDADEANAPPPLLLLLREGAPPFVR
jgi:hypothetical protein